MTTVIAAMLVPLAGCEELSSRREIQRGDKLYLDAKFSAAIEHYERALAKTPDLAIGHHNAALAYYKLFTAGISEPEKLEPKTDKEPQQVYDAKVKDYEKRLAEFEENQNYAHKAAEHFQKYLETSPDDQRIVGVLTQLWLDSDDHEKALGYWEKIHAKNPKDRDVIVKLANINRMAGQHVKALEWLQKRVEVETTDAGRAQAYIDIAQLQWGRLTNRDLVDEERVAVADAGIAALQKGLAITPDNSMAHSLMGAIYQFRSLSHGASWARTVDTAAQRFHQIRAFEIQKEAAAKAKAEAAQNPGEPEKSADKK